MADEKIIQAAALAMDRNFNPDAYPVMAAMFRDYATVAIAAIKPLIREGMLPEDAVWFPDEGSIVWQGKVYYPADYMLTRRDIEAIRAAEREQIAKEIEGRYLGPDSGRSIITGADAPDAHLRNAYDEGLEVAVKIARGSHDG